MFLQRFSFARFAANQLCRQSKILAVSQPHHRLASTLTVGIDEEKIFPTRVETSVEPYDSVCTPSTKEKIYPTRLDDYDGIPVVVDGKEYFVVRETVDNPWPVIPTLDIELEKIDDSKAPADAEGAENVSSEPTVTDLMCIEFAANMPTIHDDKRPERDNVNFPTLKEVVARPKYRLFIFPEYLFKSLYEKTGVTGPYVFLGTLGTFLLSKEWIVLEDSASSGSTFIALIAFGLYKYGKDIERYLTARVIKERQGWLDWQEGSIKLLENYIELKKNNIQSYQGGQTTSEVRRANVNLQREAEYRRRMMEVYNETMRKLNYHVAVDEAKRQFSKKHMANWIIENVYASITPQSKKAALDQCLLDLKSLASKRANAI